MRGWMFSNVFEDVPGVAEHLKPVNVMIAKLREALAAVSEEQIYLKARDLRHRTSELVLYSPSLVLFTRIVVLRPCRCKGNSFI